MKIKSIKSAGIEPVYNMTVSEHHNYMIHGGVILKNCDALRYFAIMRTLPPENDSEYEYDDDDFGCESSYEEYMCGGEPGEGYLWH